MEITETIEESISVKSAIEKKILLQILLVSLIGIALYIFNGVIILKSPDIVRESIVAFTGYAILVVWIYKPGNFLRKKRVVSFVIFLSVFSGFFVFGGLKGIAAFDILNMFFYVAVVFQGKERSFYLAILGSTLAGFFWIHMKAPELIINCSANDPEWLHLVNLMLRISLTFNIGMALRSAFSKEHERSRKLLKEVHDLNTEVTMHNEELKSMQEELQTNNDKLEQLVHERTRKLELQNETLVMYAYMNSHVFRGPVCRIQGILNLLEIEKDEEAKKQLNMYLFNEVKEIDKVVKDISSLLYESNAELLEEIRLKAKRLYNV